MTPAIGISHQRKVLKAAIDLGQPTFTLSELIVAAWQLYPDTFSLAGFPQYPDSGKVTALVVGRRGLVARRLLSRLAPNVYGLPHRVIFTSSASTSLKACYLDKEQLLLVYDRVRYLLKTLGPKTTYEQVLNHLREDGLVVCRTEFQRLKREVYTSTNGVVTH